ncbi:MAG: electron transfer flavoprotein beta subunit/FixA family protein [Dehalococcoidia bacterium]|nr:MAG: electron transfer flavoprotein beta subunit/FixA family protein [Dehalococcoidia bacterium]
MRTVVCVKQVPDSTTVKFDIRTNSLENIHYIMDPIDEVAVSEAIGIRGKSGGEVIAITLGPPRAEEVLRSCLKMGGDQAIHLCDEAFDNLDVHSTSVILAKQIARVQYDLILCGNESMDEGNGFVGAGIAETLNLPLVTAVTRIDIFADTNTAIVHRRLKGGDREIVESPLPAVFTVDSVLTKPIYPPLRTILAGLKKKITRLDAKAAGIDVKDIERTVAPLGISQPKPRLKKTATIDSSLSPAERMKLIISGGVQQKGSKTIEKLPETAAAEIIQFLIDNDIISKEE